MRLKESPSARKVWIEISKDFLRPSMTSSPSARKVWIEMEKVIGKTLVD